jgi:hypothetical protein
MIYRTLLACFAVAFAVCGVKAQDWKAYHFYQPYPGYIIGPNGDTTKGYIVHGDRIQNQNKVIFYTDVNDKKSKKEYKPSELKGYRVGDKEYRSINYSGGLLSKPLNFVLVKNDGRITEFAHYTKDEGYIIQVRKAGETDQEYDERICKEEVVFKKGEEDPIRLSSFFLSFKKNMAKLISDNPTIYAKVENGDKGYGKLNVLDIIKEYNAGYAK